MTEEGQYLCPRRVEGALPGSPEFDTWRAARMQHPGILGDTVRTCSWCGSMHPDDVMAGIEQGLYEVGPTDKNYKCQPAGTKVFVVTERSRGSRPATWSEKSIEDVRKGDMVVSYSAADCVFRHEGREVLGATHLGYAGELIAVSFDGGESRYTPDHRCVVLPGDAFADKEVVYLMQQGRRWRIGRCRGWLNSQAVKGRPGLAVRMSTEKAEAAWVLSLFDTRREAALYENQMAWKYGLPTLTFQASNASTLLDQASLDEFWSSLRPFGTVDSWTRAETCLRDHGRDIRYPLMGKESRWYRTRATEVRACNLMDGMLGISPTGPKRLSVRSEAWKHHDVYSLAVAGEETYVADGIVTHNCYVGLAGASSVGKFYYQHLSDEQRARFIELVNDGTMKIGYPGHFYVLPFFCRVLGGESDSGGGSAPH